MAGSRLCAARPYSAAYGRLVGMLLNNPAPAVVAVVGGGPAGLMAAQVLAEGGARVHVFDGMPSVGRKFLLAGRGGLNLSHAESHARFVSRYGERSAQVEPWLRDFDAEHVRAWAASLGIQTFIGSSERIFPADLKAAPLLRAWLQRLRRQGVQFHMRHRWQGWTQARATANVLSFDTPGGQVQLQVNATVLALGGGSWARLGSDGAWWPLLAAQGVSLAPLRPSNGGFEVRGRGVAGWSEHFRSGFEGQALKSVAIEIREGEQTVWRQTGEMIVTVYGIEGSLVYAASSRLRERIDATGEAPFLIDLLPSRDAGWVARELAHPRGARSLSTHLKTRLGLFGVKAGLLRELAPVEALQQPQRLAELIKALPMQATAPRPLDEAISSAGGVRFDALDDGLMLSAAPGVFCAGEMLDWEAPTGGYLLHACLASGRVAGRGALRWLSSQPARRSTAAANPTTPRTGFPGTAIP